MSCKILFITSNRIGDAVLSTGLVDYMLHKYKDSLLTIACGPLAVSLFEGLPNVEKIISLKKKKHAGHWIDLWKDVVKTRWDIVVDLRNSAVSRLIMAKERYIYGPHIDKKCHKAEQNAAVMKLDAVPHPKLVFSKRQQQKAADLIPDGAPVLGVGPTANWIGKTWPADRFIALVKHLTDVKGILPGARVAVFAAPGEEEAAYEVLKSVPEERQIDVIAKTDPGTAAAAIARCALYVGNDSGLMHCAAASSVPTVGLFGPSYPHLYSPWGTHTAFARTPETFDELIDFEGYAPQTLRHSLMKSLSLEMTIETVESFWGNLEKTV